MSADPAEGPDLGAPDAAFTAEEADTLAAARLLALEWMPYLATALLEATPVRRPGLATFAVDAGWRLYLDPDSLIGWGPHAAAGVLLHEVGHLLRAHHQRHAEQPEPHPLAWNLAADAEINDDLVAAGVPLPGAPVTPAGLGQPSGELAETYFAQLLAHDLTVADPACGSGAGGHRLPDELDLDDATAPATSELDRELVRRQVAHDIEQAAAADGPTAGHLPGGWRRWADLQLAPATIPWQHRLRRTVRRSLAVTAGQLDTSYRRPGRRRIPGVVTPGMVRPVPTVGVVLDSSASMSQPQLRAALAELDGLCRQAGLGMGELTVVSADTAVHEVSRVRHAADLPILGGGGTDLRPAIAHLATRRRPDTIIVLTDGFTPWPGQPPSRCQVTCALVPRIDGHRPPPPPAWVDTITIGAAT